MVSEAPHVPPRKSCSSCPLYEGQLIVRQATQATLEAERGRLNNSLVPDHVDRLLATIKSLLDERALNEGEDPELRIAAEFIHMNLTSISDAQKEAFRLKLAQLSIQEADQSELNRMVDELLRSVAQHGCKGVAQLLQCLWGQFFNKQFNEEVLGRHVLVLSLVHAAFLTICSTHSRGAMGKPRRSRLS